MDDDFDELLDRKHPCTQGLPLAPEEVDRRLGFNSGAITALESEVFQDLSPRGPGIAWWAGAARWEQNVCVADYLFSCISGTRRGLREAILHMRCSQQYAERVRLRYAEHINGTGKFAIPPPTCLRDELESEFLDKEVTGFFRAVATALDCLAAVVVGVVPRPLPIQKSSWRALRRNLESEAKKPIEPGKDEPASQRAAREIVDILKHGQPGWLEWTLDVRNLVAHRPPRVRYRVPDFGSDLVKDGPNIAHLRITNRLWRHPELSEIEVWSRYGSPMESLLNEPQERTMARVVHETAYLVERIFSSLTEHWRWRRANPTALPQPVDKQWPDRQQQSDYIEFEGFMPEYPKPDIGTMVVPPQTIRRMEAGLIEGPNILHWDRLHGRASARPGLSARARFDWARDDDSELATPRREALSGLSARVRAAPTSQPREVHIEFTDWPTSGIISFIDMEAPHSLWNSRPVLDLMLDGRVVGTASVLGG